MTAPLIAPPLSFDPTLGIVRLCSQCGEEWPFDEEFWYMRNGDLSPAWPRRCIACCAEYYAARRRSDQKMAKAERVHLVPDPDRCGKRMGRGRICGRALFHKHDCRSVAQLSVDASRRRAKRDAA